MNILVDLLELLVYPTNGPDTPRGWLIGGLIYGTIMAGLLGRMLLVEPSAGPTSTAVVVAFVGAPLGILFSGAHFVRAPQDRLLSALVIAANLAALTLALVLYA